MSHFYTPRKLIIGLVALLAIFSFFVWYSYRNMKMAEHETKTVNTTLQSLRSVEDIMDDVQNIETGERGYLVSGNEELLQPYLTAIRKLAVDTIEFKKLYPLYPERTASLISLLKLIGQKAEMATRSVNIAQQRQQGNRTTHVNEQPGEGKLIMDSIRDIVVSFEREDRLVLNESNSQRKATARNTGRLFIGLALIFIAGLFIISWRISRGLKMREQYEQRIAYLAGLTEKTSDAIFSTDTGLIIKTWNKAATEMYGYSAEEAIGRDVGSLLKISYPDEDLEKSRIDLDKQGHYKGEYEATKRSGEHLFIQASISVLKNDKNEREGYVAVHRDITERKKADELLASFNKELSRQVEEKTRQAQNILERISDGFYSLDANWCFTYMNKTAAVIMECDPKEIVGKNLWKEYPAAANLSIYNAYVEAFASQENRAVEFYYPPYDKWFMVHIYPSPSGLSTFFRDVTEIRTAEEELKRSNGRFEMITRTTNDAIWEWDFLTGKMWGNETHQQLYGLTLNDPIPQEKEWQERIHPEDRQGLINKQAEALASDTNIFITEYRFNTQEHGYKNIYDRCYIVRDSDGKATRILGSMMDITNLKKAEEKLKRREAQLVASIENTPNVAVQWYNLKGHVVYWNYASELIYGWTSDEAMGNTLDQLTDTKELAAEFLQTLEEISRTGRTIGPKEFPFRRKNGQEGFCLATMFSIPSVEGEPYFVCMDVDITESKRYAEALEESEEKYRSMIEQASDGIFIIDQDGNYSDVNTAATAMTGYTKEEIKKMTVADFLPQGQTSVIKLKKEELKSGKPVILERKIKRKDGVILETEVSYKMLSNGYIIAITRDISERKKAEEALITSEETLRLIMNSALDAIVGMDTNGLITIWTPQAEKIFGWTEEEAIGKKMSDVIIPHQYREAHGQGLTEYMKSGKGPVLNKLIQVTALNSKGDEFPVELSILPVQQGENKFFCAFIRDITERKKAEQVVRESEEKYRTLVEQAVDAIALYDATGRILDVNTGSVNLLGYSKEELMRMSLSEILTKEEIMEKPVRYDVLQEGSSTVKERMMRRKDGVVIETEVRSQQLPDGRFLSVIRDLTERIRAEQDLAATYEAIRKLTAHIQDIREEERTNIAREIHDELGQQLTVLKMDVSWLKKKMGTVEEPVKQKLKDLITMLDETVRTVRRISSELRPSILDDLGLVAAMEWQLGEFEKRSDMATHLIAPEEELKLPDAIKTALFRIFQESLTNVARHSNAKTVTVTIARKEDNLVLSIIDDGKGFDKQKIADKKTLGILGMRERIAMIGGFYEIKSQPEKGTEVLVQVSLKNTKPGII